MFIVAALYQFKAWPNFKEDKTKLFEFCQKHEIMGSLLVAHEGINGTVAGSREGITVLHTYLTQTLGFNDLEYKESFAHTAPFHRMKVRLKKEIVTLAQSGTDPHKKVGTYVQPEDWNALISEPDVLVIDTRNDYEYQIGTFKNALNPDIQTFTQFPEYLAKKIDPKKHKRIATFCTGGIRCEKATSYMLEQGYEEVYHLKGGILKYLEEIPESESLWEGSCFVFDQRVAVSHGLHIDNFSLCHACRSPLSDTDRGHTSYEHGVSCPHCIDKMSDADRARFREREKQIALSKERGETHIGVARHDDHGKRLKTSHT